MSEGALVNRRRSSRLETEGLLINVRRKGRLTRLVGVALDFNRYGMALVLDQPLPRECTVYLSLMCPEQKLDNVIGVVHNCVSIETGYRCGIQFRLGSELQSDRRAIEKGLQVLEKFYAGALASEIR